MKLWIIYQIKIVEIKKKMMKIWKKYNKNENYELKPGDKKFNFDYASEYNKNDEDSNRIM